MKYEDKFNSERYLDMTAYLAMRNIEKKERKQHMRPNWIYHRGDVYLVELDPHIGSEQGGTRPVVILQNDVGNRYCPTLIVAPITTQCYKKSNLPVHYYASQIYGLQRSGTVLLEQIRTIDKSRVIKPLGKFTQQQMDEIGTTIAVSLAMENRTERRDCSEHLPYHRPGVCK